MRTTEDVARDILAKLNKVVDIDYAFLREEEIIKIIQDVIDKELM